MHNLIVEASEVQEDDTLVDLDNGYVFEVEEAQNVFTMHAGRQYVGMASGHIAIGFHDSNGEENYLIVWSDHPINVKRG